MRVINALKADAKFQFKQGFYIIYIVMTLMYMAVIRQFPQSIGNAAIPIIVFSDPSLVGFFFIGGIVMLEKQQGILEYIVVTPLRTKEYLAAKAISLGLLAEVAGFAISLVTFRGSFNWFLLAGSIGLTAVFFTLYGFIVAAGCHTINQYFVRMVPYMLIIVVPFISFFNVPYAWVLSIFPSAAGLKLVYGAFHGIHLAEALLYTVSLILWDALILLIVEKVFDRKIVYGGE